MTSTHTLRIHDAAPEVWFVLVHAKHGRTAHDREVYNSGLPRMLNSNGRWSAHPTREVPVLVWRDRAAAEEALAVCRQHRGDAVVVSTFGDSGMELGRELTPFTPQHAAALAGYLPYDATAGVKAEAARKKALASAAFLVARSTGDEHLAARARELSPKAGAGAADYLVGTAGGAVAAAILKGEIEADQWVTPKHVAAAIEIAKGIIAARGGSAGFRGPRR